MQIVLGTGEEVRATCRIYVYPDSSNKRTILCEPRLQTSRVKIQASGRKISLTLCEVSIFATGKIVKTNWQVFYNILRYWLRAVLFLIYHLDPLVWDMFRHMRGYPESGIREIFSLESGIPSIGIRNPGLYRNPESGTHSRFLNGIRNILESGIPEVVILNTRSWNPEYLRLESGILEWCGLLYMGPICYPLSKVNKKIIVLSIFYNQ